MHLFPVFVLADKVATDNSCFSVYPYRRVRRYLLYQPQRRLFGIALDVFDDCIAPCPRLGKCFFPGKLRALFRFPRINRALCVRCRVRFQSDLFLARNARAICPQALAPSPSVGLSHLARCMYSPSTTASTYRQRWCEKRDIFSTLYTQAFCLYEKQKRAKKGQPQSLPIINYWHGWQDLNLHLTVLETVALPIKLHPHVKIWYNIHR